MATGSHLVPCIDKSIQMMAVVHPSKRLGRNYETGWNHNPNFHHARTTSQLESHMLVVQCTFILFNMDSLILVQVNMHFLPVVINCFTQ